MGISIEQYRVHIGTYNCIRMKNYQTCLKDSFYPILIFQLLYIVMVIMLMFVPMCHLGIFCVSSLHLNTESYYCLFAVQIEIFALACICYLSILYVTNSSKISKPLCLCFTNSSSICATNRMGKPLCHCHTSNPASHCATAAHQIQQAVVPPLQTEWASHCATATQQILQAIVPLLQIEWASHCATATQQIQQAILPLLRTECASHCATAIQLNQQAVVTLLQLNQQATVLLLFKRTRTFRLKCFDLVIVLFTQISGHNVYVPMLLRMAKDVEENPGPTIYDVVDPTKTICADFSQGNAKKFQQNAGKQCLAMSLTAIIYNYISNLNTWDSTVLNSILCAGNNLYSFISNSVKKSYLLLTDVPKMVSVFGSIYCSNIVMLLLETYLLRIPLCHIIL